MSNAPTEKKEQKNEQHQTCLIFKAFDLFDLNCLFKSSLNAYHVQIYTFKFMTNTWM